MFNKQRVQKIASQVSNLVDLNNLFEKTTLSIEEKAQNLKIKVLLKESNNKIKEFYKNENYNKIINLILEDDSYLTSMLATKPAAPVRALTSLELLQQKYGGENITGSPTIEIGVAEKILALNFFALFKEAHTQKELYEKFPKHVLTSSLELARFNEFLTSINALEIKILSVASKKNITMAITNEITKKKNEVKVYHDIIALVK